MITIEHRPQERRMLVQIETWTEAITLRDAGLLSQGDWEDWVDCATGHFGGTDKFWIPVDKIEIKEM